MRLILRRARWYDILALYRWRNDTLTRQQSLTVKPISWREHWRWFHAVQRDQTHRAIMIARVVWVGVPMRIGTMRLERICDKPVVFEVHITVAPRCRGFGYAAEMLGRIVRAVEDEHFEFAVRLVAWVRPNNVASLRSFERAGFIRVIGQERWNAVLMEKLCSGCPPRPSSSVACGGIVDGSM